MRLHLIFMRASDRILEPQGERRRLIAVLGISVFLLQLLTPSLHAIAEHSAAGTLVAQSSSQGVSESLAQSKTGASRSAATPGTTTHDPSQCVICKSLAQLRGNIVVVAAAFIHAPSPQTVAIPNARLAVASSGLDESSSPRAPPTPNPIAA